MKLKILKIAEEKYPTTLNILLDHYVMSSKPIGRKMLYRFFDEKKLRGSVYTNTAGTWSFDIYVPKPIPKNLSENSFLGWDRISYFSISSYSREEAEDKMFEEMFKMLEEKM